MATSSGRSVGRPPYLHNRIRDGRYEPGDEIAGGWPLERLLRMNDRFVERMERALRTGWRSDRQRLEKIRSRRFRDGAAVCARWGGSGRFLARPVAHHRDTMIATSLCTLDLCIPIKLPGRCAGGMGTLMLKFNEGKACEAIVRRLEARESLLRTGVRSPEREGHQFPVEIAFTLGNQLFALEHTGIEPFKGHVRMEAQAEWLFAPITNALKNSLGTDALFELYMPVNALQGRQKAEVQTIQQAIIEWVKKTAPTVPKRPNPDYRGSAVGPTAIQVIPFPVSLWRFAPPVIPGHHFQIRHSVENIGQLRSERMKKAIDKKFPKLAAWKKTKKAKTILVLEQNDIQLTNPSIVADTFLPLALASPDRPDETYLVASWLSPWYAWPILIGGKSYFDFAESDEVTMWKFDPATLVALTNR
jgi:hypothetical protein